MQQRRRLVLLVVLVVCTLGLCVHYGATYDQHWPHPTGEQLADDPDGWDGELVLLFGDVQEPTSDGFVMTVEDDSETVVRTVTVRGTDADVAVGGVVQVYGRLSEQGTVQTAESVVVVNRDAGDSRYKLLTSLFGGVLAAGVFVRHWHIDIRGLGFRNREQRGGQDG